MKRIFGLIAVLVTLALGTSAFAGPFTAGNVVVYRIGDGVQTVTNLGQTVFLDEYTTNQIIAQAGCSIFSCTPLTPVQSIMMPTNWVGNQGPLIADGSSSACGYMTRSSDGRYLVVPGYACSVAYLTNLTGYAFSTIKGATNGDISGAYTTNAVTEADVPRVIGLVDGNGNIYTTTTLTNVDEDGDDITAGASIDGTNLWVAGRQATKSIVRFTTRGSMVSTAVCGAAILNTPRAIGIYGNISGGAALFTDRNTAFGQATDTSAAHNLIAGDALPTNSFDASYVTIAPVTNGSMEGFAMFNLNNGNDGGNMPDTLYLCDSAANFTGEHRNYGGAVEKYCYVGSAWTYEGSIGAEDAMDVAGYQNGQTVSLYITEGTNADMYYQQDTSGYNNQTGEPEAGRLESYLAPGGLVNTRGIAVVPQGGDSGTLSPGAGPIQVGPPYGPYFRGPQGGTFTPANGVQYSVANFGTASAEYSVSGGPNWLMVSPSSATLSANGGSATVTLTANSNANTLNGGQSYSGSLFWHTGNALGVAHYTNVATIVVDAFYLNPTTNCVFYESNPGSGSFAPSGFTYALSNSTPTSLNFSAFASNNWTSLRGAISGAGGSVNQVTDNSLSGSVPGKEAVNITVSINANGANTAEVGAYGSYVDYLTCSNVSASSQVATKPTIYIQVGFGVFDDFSTYAVGNVSGQNGWGGGAVPPDINPVQIVYTTLPGGTISSNLYVVPGGCVNATGSSQQPEQYISAGPVTNAFNIVDNVTNNVPTYAITGMNVVFTNAPTSPNYVFEQGNPYLNWNDAGVIANGSGYSWTTELDQFETGGGPEGSAIYNFNQLYQVYFVTDFVESNAYVFVNPPGGVSAGVTDGVSLVANCFTGNVGAVHSTGASCPDADCIANSAQGWDAIILGQYSGSCPSVNMAGYFVTRAAASTNYAQVYNFLNPAPACTAPTASFTPTSASGAAPLTVNFTDTSTANSGTLTTWVWTYGDGGMSSTESPTYAYTTPGSYTASLSVTNSCGDGSASPATAAIYVSDAYAWWATNAYTLSGSLTGGNASYTGDGMSNTNKFLAGFSPTSAAAYLHVISVSRAVVGSPLQTNITVTYLGASGDSTWTPGVASRTNILEYSTGSGNGSYNGTFQVVPGSGSTNILSGGIGQGLTASMTASNVDASEQYFRVRVLLP